MTLYRAAAPYRAAALLGADSLFVASVGGLATGLNTVLNHPTEVQNRDFMLLFIYWNNGGGATLTASALTNEGWEQAGSTVTDQNLSSAVYWKIAAAGDASGNANINFSVSAKRGAVMHVSRGPTTVHQISSTSEGATSVLPHLAPNVTTSESALVLNCIGDRGATVWSTTASTPAGTTLRTLVPGTDAAYSTIVLSDSDRATAAATQGAATSTFNQTSPMAIGWTVALGGINAAISHALTGSGSLTTSGSAATFATRALAATGGLVSSGSADARTTIMLSATGSGTTSGSAAALVLATLAASGTLVTSGASSLTVSAPLNASGELTTAGSADVAVEAILGASGTLVTGGSAAITRASNTAAEGSLVTSGSAAISVLVTLSAEGIVVTSGSVASTFSHALAAAGELTTSGTAAALLLKAIGAEGLLETSGSVRVRQDADRPPIAVHGSEPVLHVVGGRRVLIVSGRQPSLVATR